MLRREITGRLPWLNSYRKNGKYSFVLCNHDACCATMMCAQRVLQALAEVEKLQTSLGTNGVKTFANQFFGSLSACLDYQTTTLKAEI